MYRFIIADRAWKESSVANNLAYPRIKKYNKLYLFKKIGKNSVHSVCQVQDYDLLITDNKVSEDFLIRARELGAAIETVDLRGE